MDISDWMSCATEKISPGCAADLMAEFELWAGRRRTPPSYRSVEAERSSEYSEQIWSQTESAVYQSTPLVTDFQGRTCASHLYRFWSGRLNLLHRTSRVALIAYRPEFPPLFTSTITSLWRRGRIGWFCDLCGINHLLLFRRTFKS